MMGSKAEKEKEVSMKKKKKKKRVMKMDQMIRKWCEKVVNTNSRMEHVEHDDIWVSVLSESELSHSCVITANQNED